MDIDRQYANLGLGLVDASIVALAEELGLYRLRRRPRADPAVSGIHSRLPVMGSTVSVQ